MNLVGGNLPVIVAPLRAYFNEYRSALCLVWLGFLTISAFIFILSSLEIGRIASTVLMNRDTPCAEI